MNEKIFKVPILVSDEVNHNKRIYSKTIIEKIIYEYTPDKIIGQIDQKEPCTDLIEAPHIVNKLYLENNTLYADITILDTPKGKILSNLYKDDLIEFTTEGIGSIESSGNYYVVKDDYNLLSISASLKKNEK